MAVLTFKSSGKSLRACALSHCLSLCLQPRVILVLAALLLITTATIFLYWPKLTNPVDVITVERSYGIVVDAGSSSSKVHLFEWPLHDGDPAKLLTIKPVVNEFGEPRTKKVEPGIATFSQSPETAFTSLQPLLEFALSCLPSSQHTHTVLYILCTAGMRLLPSHDQSTMVQLLQQRVAQEYPFHLPHDGVQVISGKLEGVFSWISINYLLGRLGHEYQHPPNKVTFAPASSSGNRRPPHSSSHAIRTVGSLDMGGASLQVTFEVPRNVEVPQESVVEIDLGCGVDESQHTHRVFVSTYLGYGSNEVQGRYYRRLLRAHLDKTNESSLDGAIHLHSLRDPCSPLEFLENVTIDRHSIKIRGLGDFRGCKRSLLPLLHTTSGSEGERMLLHAPCPGPGSSQNCTSIAGFQRPPVTLKYESLDFYGTSEFWYTMRDVLQMGGHYSTSSFEHASSEYCQTNWKVLMDRFLKNLYVHADYHRLKSQCMKSAWLSLVLHEGLGFSEDAISLHTTEAVEGQSVQWALGALLYNTRYLPLREIQHLQLQAPPLSEWQVTYSSSFLLPFLTVLCVASLLLYCRRRKPYLSTHGHASGRDPSHNSTQPPNSLHHRMNSALSIVGLDAAGGTPLLQVGSTLGSEISQITRSGSKLKFVV